MIFFANHLNPGGLLIITNLGFNKMNDEQYLKHPMHIPIKFDAIEYLLKLGFEPTKYPWMFIKKTFNL